MNDEFDASLGASQPLDVPAGPFEVRPGCWMVGHRNPASLLQCNTYVRSFESGASRMNICVDPGSQLDYAVVEANISQLIGDVGELDAFSVNHQDPDVIGNAQYLCDANPNISAMVTEDVWRLAQHLLLKPARVHFMNSAKSPLTVVGDSHRWQLVPTPFCHFRGAMAFYDPEIRVLFSGDLFGGLNQIGRVHLTATEEDWAGVAQFHQIYMPSREVLRYAVRQIRALTPAVEVIAPQHGYIITGDQIPLYLDRMEELLVGHDLLALELDETFLNRYLKVIEQVIDSATETLGREEIMRRIQSTETVDGLESQISFQGEAIQLNREGYSAVVKLIDRLCHDESSSFANGLRSIVLTECVALNIPIPPVGVGVAESPDSTNIGPDGIQTQAWWM